MSHEFTDRIKKYCEATGIEIPAAFYRRPARRYAMVDLDASPPKLVATTWFTQEDVLRYWQTNAVDRAVKILDLKGRHELVVGDEGNITHGKAF
jgi:hypothetical protein